MLEHSHRGRQRWRSPEQPGTGRAPQRWTVCSVFEAGPNNFTALTGRLPWALFAERAPRIQQVGTKKACLWRNAGGPAPGPAGLQLQLLLLRNFCSLYLLNGVCVRVMGYVQRARSGCGWGADRGLGSGAIYGSGRGAQGRGRWRPGVGMPLVRYTCECMI